jgi:hypothetical protein
MEGSKITSGDLIMSAKTASVISSLVTAILVLLIAVIFGFGGIVLLNGFMNASAAVYTGFACLGITVILCAILAWALAKAFISRFNWNNILAVIISIFISTLLGGGMGFGSLVVMGIVAEVMWRS